MERLTELQEKLLESLSSYRKVKQNPDELTETEKLIKANEEACSTAQKEFNAANTAHRRAEEALKTANDQVQLADQALVAATRQRELADIKCQKINQDFIKNIKELDKECDSKDTPDYMNKRAQLYKNEQLLLKEAVPEQIACKKNEDKNRKALTSALEAKKNAVENLAAKETNKKPAWDKLMAAKKLVPEQGLYDPTSPTSPTSPKF